MSELFVYHPRGSETLEAFNARLTQFCSDNPVVDIDMSMVLGEGISLSFVEAKDMMFALTQALQPVVLRYDSNFISTLERFVADYQKQLAAQQPNLTVLRYKQLSSEKTGYVVLIIHAYDIELEADQDPVGDGDEK